MRICLLTNNFNPDNGGGRFALEYVEHLRKQDRDLEITILTRVPAKVECVQPILYSGRLRLLAAIPCIRKVLKRCDVVHAFDTLPYGLIAALANLGVDKKLVITALGSGSLRPLQTFWMRRLAKWTCRRADVVTAISNYTAREIKKKLSDLDVVVIPLGTNFEYFKNQTRDCGNRDERERFNRFKPFILSVGKLKKRKGYDVSIEVYGRLLKKFPDLDYVIIGRGDGKYF